METRRASNTDTVPQEKAISRLVSEVSTHTLALVASLSTHPLVSVVAAAYTLGLLYLPRYLLSLLISPVAVSTLLLLATLLHLGSTGAQSVPENHPAESQHDVQSVKEKQKPLQQRQHLRPSPPCAPLSSFPHNPVFWGEHHHFPASACHGPLEVIYEEYEGEEDDDMDSPPSCRRRSPGPRLALDGMPMLGLLYTDDDSGSECSGISSSPGWDSPENLCFRWEVEEDGLIEISLEEESLIEIDLSACQ